MLNSGFLDSSISLRPSARRKPSVKSHTSFRRLVCCIRFLRIKSESDIILKLPLRCTESPRREIPQAWLSDEKSLQMDWLENEVAEFFIAEGRRLGLSDVPGSRRVIVHDLPPEIGLGSVLEAVSAVGNLDRGVVGGIVSAQIFQDPTCQKQQGSRCAIIEFVHPSAALEYVAQINDRNVWFRVTEGQEEDARCEVKAYLASSLSNDPRPDTIYMLLAEQTRSLTIPVLPAEAVWELLCVIGVHLMTKVEYRPESTSLHLEFVSMFEADRAFGLLKSGYYTQFPTCELATPYFSRDSTDREFDAIPQLVEKLPDHLNPSAFNHAPYNVFNQSLFKSWTPFHRPSLAKRICLRNSLMHHELIEWLDSRRSFKTQHFNIAGSGLRITRKAYTWSLDTESQIKLLLSTSLDCPNLSEAWDDYFRLRRLPNLRRYEAYRMVVSGDSSSIQSESEDEKQAETSDAGDWSEESLVEDPIHVIKTPYDDDPALNVDTNNYLTSIHKRPHRPLGRSTSIDDPTVHWIFTEVISTAAETPGSSGSMLLPDLPSSEPKSWAMEDYEDWLSSSQVCPCAEEEPGVALKLGDCDDLISFE